MLWVVAGLVALALLAEGALRLFAPGYSSHYLVSGRNADGTPVWMDNAFFSYRFFPRRTAPLPLPVRVPRERASGTLRVVVLGDTDFLGEPDPSFGVGRILEPLLQAKMPDRRVEVLSLGIRNGNSHVMREIARDLPRLKPDAVVLFAGNNEIAGPYGPASPTGRLHTSSRIARLLILLNRTQLRQTLASWWSARAPAREDTLAWRGEEPLTLRDRLDREDPRLRTAERSFRKNYRAAVSLARDAAPVVVPCTVPMNLRDCAPFATAYLSDETQAQRVRETLRAALALEKAGEDAPAYRKYQEALAIQPDHAEALFRAARLAERLGNGPAAAHLYRQACDADALPLRATSAFNEAIRDVARQNRLEPFDAESVLAEASETGVPGHDLFWDHVHCNFAARHRLAAELASRLAWELDAPTADAPVPGADEVSGLLLFSPWGKRYELDAVIHGQLGQPFLRQLTHTDTVERLRNEFDACVARQNALSGDVVHEIFSRRLDLRPDDAWLSARAAYYLLQSGDLERAERAADAALRQWPHRYDARALLAFVKTIRGRPLEEGLAILRPGNEKCGYFDVLHAISVAKNLAARDLDESAEAWLRYALGRDPYNSDASIALANALYQQHHSDEAVEVLKQALARTPDNPLLWDELSVLYCLIGEWSLSDEAMEHSDRIAPYRFQRLYRRAEALSRIRQYRRAVNPIVRYLEAVPEDPEAIALHQFIFSKIPKQPEPADPSPVQRKRMPWE